MPITTPDMISGIVTYLSGRLSKDKSVNKFVSELTEATINWIEPLFLKEDKSPKEMIEKLSKDPQETLYQDSVKNALAISVKEDPNAEKFIREIFDQISKTDEGGKVVNNIINSKNVNTGNVNTSGGSFHIGDAK